MYNAEKKFKYFKLEKRAGRHLLYTYIIILFINFPLKISFILHMKPQISTINEIGKKLTIKKIM